MKHAHRGPKDMACVGCYQEVEDRLAAHELRTRRFWRCVILSFVAIISASCAWVIWKIRRT